MQHPCPLKGFVDPILTHSILENEVRRVIKPELTTQLPPSISEKTGPMRGVRRANFLSLVPVSHIVGLYHANWTGHSDKGSKPDQPVLQQRFCLEASMNEKSVHSNRMTAADSKTRKAYKNENSIYLRKEEGTRYSSRSMPKQPQSLGRRV